MSSDIQRWHPTELTTYTWRVAKKSLYEFLNVASYYVHRWSALQPFQNKLSHCED